MKRVRQPLYVILFKTLLIMSIVHLYVINLVIAVYWLHSEVITMLVVKDVVVRLLPHNITGVTMFIISWYLLIKVENPTKLTK